MPEVQFTIDPKTGQLELQVRGVAGPACDDVGKLARELLGDPDHSISCAVKRRPSQMNTVSPRRIAERANVPRPATGGGRTSILGLIQDVLEQWGSEWRSATSS